MPSTRTTIVAGNWKMYKTVQDAVQFAEDLKAVPDLLADAEKTEVLICPPFTAIAALHEAFDQTPIKVGAQNVHEMKEGAFTGNISVPMLQGLADYVILGHSEVRRDLAETDQKINKKVKLLLENQIRPIVAVGESLAQRQEGSTETVVFGQVLAAFDGIDGAAAGEIVIAYEPLWAIGSGLACDPVEANRVCAGIRGVLADRYGQAVADTIRIQYGGSVKPDNMLSYMQQPDIDGALIGSKCRTSSH
jgi:triosephosphate isomerase